MKHKYAEWIKKFADGENVEYSWGSLVNWYSVDCLSFFDKAVPDTQFRVKPKDVVLYGIAFLEKDYAQIRFLGPINQHPENNIKLTFEAEGKLKGAEVL
jgi:hypothetical protein